MQLTASAGAEECEPTPAAEAETREREAARHGGGGP
jgi:hypothetical protein